MHCTLSLMFALAFPQQKEPPPVPAPVWELLQQKYDADEDGRITPEEHGRGVEAFRNLDRDGDGAITRSDTLSSGRGIRRREPRREHGPRRVRIEAPKEGDRAPDFELRLWVQEKEVKKGKGTRKEVSPKIRLSSFAGKKPVALIFGSYT